MALREQFSGQLKAAMLAGDAPRVSTLRMVMAKLKDSDIAARPKGVQAIPEGEILALLTNAPSAACEQLGIRLFEA